MDVRLTVSISGIDPARLRWCAGFLTALEARGMRASLLVDPIRIAPRVRDWLAEREASGDLVVTSPGIRFDTLPAHEAGLRLLAARGSMEAARLRTEAFAASGWLASAGTLEALRRNGYRVCARRGDVLDLRTGATSPGKVLEPGPTLGARTDRAARRGGLIRLHVPAGSDGRAALRAVDIALARGASAMTFADLTPQRAVPARAR